MEELKILRRIDKIKAPQDFERLVLARLERGTAGGREKAGRPVFLKAVLAGAGALLLVGGIYLGLNDRLGGPLPLETAGKDPSGRSSYGSLPADGRAGSSGMVPLLETVDYSDEIHGNSRGAQTVYLLEQVSEGSSSGIKF